MTGRIGIVIAVSLAGCGVATAASLTKEQAAILDRIEASAGRQAVQDYLDRKSRVRPVSRAPVAAAAAPDAGPSYQDELGHLVRKGERRAPADRSDDAVGKRIEPAPPKQYAECAGFRFLLRRDWTDMGLLGCPKDVADATGAEIAFANDRENRNRLWSVNGTAALVYNSLADPISPLFPTATSFGVYTTVNRLYNSSSEYTADNINKVVYGLTADFLYATAFGANVFSFRGGKVEDNLAHVSSAAFTGEYSPVIAPLFHSPIPLRALGLPYWIRVDPSLVVQYNEVTGEDQLLAINDMTRALRVGPQVAVKLGAYPGGTTFLSRFHASFVYHRAYEVYSHTHQTWMTTSAGVNIDDSGHLAVTFTYSRGDDEDTGKFTNVYRLGLTGKI